MPASIPVYAVELPGYYVHTEPDHQAIGKVVDDELRKHFMGQKIVVRGVSSAAHPHMSTNELVAAISTLGTDRYDPNRAGDRYDNLAGKHIDLFAFRRTVTPRMQLFRYISWGFYHGGITIHGAPIRIDTLIIYDASQLKAVLHQYQGRTDLKRDGFVFRDPANKVAAVKGIITISETG